MADEKRPVGHLRVESIFPSAGQSIMIGMKKPDLAPGSYYLIIMNAANFIMNAANNPMYKSRTQKIIVTK